MTMGPWRLRETGLGYAPVFVVDASVSLAAVFEDTWSEAARRLFALAGKSDLHLIVPDIHWYEIANVLRHRIAHAPLATVALHRADFPSVAGLAAQENLTVSDAAYLLLAQRTGCNLISQDRKLLGAAQGRFTRALDEVL